MQETTLNHNTNEKFAMQVKKRDGRNVKFNITFIENAISEASKAVGLTEYESYNTGKEIGAKVLSKINHLNKDVIAVEEIQDIIENVLMCSSKKAIAKKYIEYRHERDIFREGNGKLLKDIQQFLDRSSDEFTNENSNKDSYSVNTHRDLIAGIVSKHYAVTQFMPKDVARAHQHGFIWQHDTDYYISPLTNCCLINYPDMLANGFKIGDAEIEQPKSIGVATTILTQIVQAVASAQYGGSTLSHIDTHLAPYVEMSYNKLVEKSNKGILNKEHIEHELDKEVYDAMQTFLYQVNSLTTTNGQAPFISISFGLDTSKFGKMITRNYLKVHREGVGKNKITPVFPKVIFFLQEGVNMNPTDPSYDLKRDAIDCSVERIYPDWISLPLNKKVTGAEESATTPMGCRAFLSKYTENKGEKTLGRLNLGVVSLNLPMIAQQAKVENIDFYKNLDYYCELAYKAHMARLDRLKHTKARQNPVMFMYGAISRLKADDSIEQLFYHGRSSISIGYIGVAETCEILAGNQDKQLATEILNFISGKCAEFDKRSNVAFSEYGTPSEGYCHKAATSFKKMFGEGIIERDYITNSFHQPVWEESSPFSKWGYEEGFAYISKGGNISYVEQPSLKNNKKAYESLVDFAYTKIPYFGINTPIDRCFKCGYNGEFTASDEGFKCPDCGNSEEGTISVIRRVSGYLTAPNSRPFNKGKQQEVEQRMKHKG